MATALSTASANSAIAPTPTPPSTPDIPPQNASNHPTPANASRRPGRPQSSTLSARQRYALACLLAGHTDLAISRALKINRKTLYTWKHNHPLFRAAYEEGSIQTRDAVSCRLANALLRSTDTLRRHLKSDDPLVAFRAARALLSPAMLRAIDPRPAPSPES
jgi:DNA-binding CsgD family transcriptional regulator